MIQNESQTRLKASQMMRRPITWTQISLEASEDLRGLIGREPKAAQLVLALIEQMEPGGGGIVVASRTTMAELIGASVLHRGACASGVDERGVGAAHPHWQCASSGNQ